MTARSAITFREAFDGPTRVQPPPPKYERQHQNARAETRAEKRGILMMKLAATADAKGEERAKVSAAPSSSGAVRLCLGWATRGTEAREAAS